VGVGPGDGLGVGASLRSGPGLLSLQPLAIHILFFLDFLGDFLATISFSAFLAAFFSCLAVPFFDFHPLAILGVLLVHSPGHVVSAINILAVAVLRCVHEEGLTTEKQKYQ